MVFSGALRVFCRLGAVILAAAGLLVPATVGLGGGGPGGGGGRGPFSTAGRDGGGGPRGGGGGGGGLTPRLAVVGGGPGGGGGRDTAEAIFSIGWRPFAVFVSTSILCGRRSR